MVGITAVWIISRFLSGTVYSYHGYFRFGSGFMPVFVKFYGSLMAHGYGSEKSRVVMARFNRGLTAVMCRGFETVKCPVNFPGCAGEKNNYVKIMMRL